MRLFGASSFAVTVLLLALPGWCATPASTESAWDGEEARLRATLLLDLDEERGRGSVGVLFDLDPGWHLYWRNPGDSGLAPQLDFDFVGREVERGPLQWPEPRAFREDVDLTTYGYVDQVLLAAPLTFSDAAGDGRIRVEADVLVCADKCLPASFSLERPFAVDAESSKRATARALFERYATRVPSSAAERGFALSARSHEASPASPLRLSLGIDGCPVDLGVCPGGVLDPKRAQFFPYAPGELELRATGVTPAEDGGLRVELEGRPMEDAEAKGTLRGVLVLDGEGGHGAFDVALAFSGESSEAGTGTAAGGVGFGALLRAIALGFLGGLLLNLMPCVLPVLAIKVFAIAEMAERGRRAGLVHAAAYTTGILASLLAFGLCVVALRWSGTAVGWGFHLQEPVFVAGVASVLVLFAMNLLGAFELSVDTSRLGAVGASASGARRSFFDGLLAVILATPCSAPFLGTAVGFAFASSAPVILAIFASIGLGLAAPFVAIAIAPRGSRFVPRSGPWMIELRRGLGFTLLLSALWLAWVVGRAAGVDAMAGLLVLLLGLAFCGWILGLAQRGGRRAPVVAVLSGAVALFAAGIDVIDLEPISRGETPRSGSTRPFTETALAEGLAAGRPAFVYFTADWCLTCKVNERRVLSEPAAREALETHGFDVFRADWTRRDEAIRAQLARLGKAGVPAYALYTPDAPDDPRLLSEILTLDGFVTALGEVAASVQRADPGRESTPGGPRIARP